MAPAGSSGCRECLGSAPDGVVATGARLDPSRAHLFGRLGVIEAAVRATVSDRRMGDPQPDDPFRGLYVSDDHVDKLLEGPASGVVEVPGAREQLERVEAEADAA